MIPLPGPLLAETAFKAGHLGVMDYYNLKNVQADTEMRKSLGGGTDKGTSAT